MPKICAFAGKGGVGKTTISGMLVRYLVEEAKDGPVLAVDADPNSNLNEILGTEVNITIGEARELIKKEVPEVAENSVKIFAISREPGIKSKVAVYSTDKAIDPVGAIVGMNGNRVLAITKELRGERIDVIAWSSAPERFIASALTPAEVVKVHLIDPVNHVAEVTVKDETLSAAIGKKGVNIKLASKLTQWDIQIANRKSEPSEEKQTKQ